MKLEERGRVGVEANNPHPLSTSTANTFLLLQTVSLQDGGYLWPAPGMFLLPEQSLSGTWDAGKALNLLRSEETTGLREEAHSEGRFLHGGES